MPASELYYIRTTYVFNLDGGSEVIEAPWSEPTIAHAQLKKQWIGYTAFSRDTEALAVSHAPADSGRASSTMYLDQTPSNVRPHIWENMNGRQRMVAI